LSRYCFFYERLFIMIIRRIASSMAALALVGGTLVAVAGSASADEVWYQSVGRASAEAPCPVSTGTELAAGWTQWSPSWAQWGNQGKGGFVCDRQITWAYNYPGCQFFADLSITESLDSEPFIVSIYAQFGNELVIAAGSDLFTTPDCSEETSAAVTVNVIVNTVFAGSQGQAQSLCPVDTVAVPGTDESYDVDGFSVTISNSSPNIFFCEPFVPV
jgi:hypothetical protein